MKFVRYGKYVGEPADAIDLEELVKRLGDFFLQSGFESQFYGMNEMDPEKSMEALREAILRALQEGDLLPEGALSDEMRDILQNADALNNPEIRELLDKLMERLAQEGFINAQQPPYRPSAIVAVKTASRRTVLRVEYPAPSLLGLLGPHG